MEAAGTILQRGRVLILHFGLALSIFGFLLSGLIADYSNMSFGGCRAGIPL
jgi:uncharacterized membrane protein